MSDRRQWSPLLGTVLSVMVFLVLTVSQSALAAPPPPTCPPDYAMVSGVCFPTNTGLSSTPLATVVMNVMNWMLAVLGFIAVLGFVISGIQYLLSAGDDDIISTAKRNMKYSVIGVVVALSGRVLIIAIDNLLVASGPTF